jgi:predicted kinase
MRFPPPRLILLNGPPAIGKSTLAGRYVADHPLALNLDVDTVRGMLGRWRDRPTEAGLRARAIAVEMGRVHLRAGHDVVIPQFLARPEFPEQIERLAEEEGVSFAEFVLLDARENAVRRFVERTAAAATPAHTEAAEALLQFGGPDELERMYDRLLGLLTRRPHAQVIRSRAGDVDAVYAEFCHRLDG